MVYTPPEGAELLRDKLVNWERYIHADDGVDPLIRLAITHYQFEAIHPFTYGNGRTGRVLNLLFLVEKDLLDIPVLYLSRYIIDNKKTHYDRLLAVTTDGAWEPWILFMLAAPYAKLRHGQRLKSGRFVICSTPRPTESGGICKRSTPANSPRSYSSIHIDGSPIWSPLGSPSANPLPFISRPSRLSAFSAKSRPAGRKSTRIPPC